MKIQLYKSEVLFKKAREVLDSEFGEELDKTLSDMATLMYTARGVGLSGPQVNDSRRILVADLGYVRGENYGTTLVKMVNPKVIESSEGKVKAEEGCLSYPELAVKVDRPTSVKIKYQDSFGQEIVQDFSDWEARIIMHEIDHLEGITLYSRASNIKKTRYNSKMKKAGFK